MPVSLLTEDVVGIEQFGTFRKANDYDPIKIVVKIVALQLIYTALLGGLVLLARKDLGALFNPGKLLSVKEPLVSLVHVTGFLLIALVMGIFEGIIVGRSKQCLDYGATMYGVHTLLCISISGVAAVVFDLGVPMLTLTQCALTVQLGRLQCQKAELLPIPLGMASSPSGNGSNGDRGEGGYLGKLISGTVGRVRSLLPMFTGLLARVVRTTPQEAMIPLNSAGIARNPTASLPMTPKRV